MKEKISIIMAVYNTSEYLKSSIESVLNQTYKNIELIIIDDCSTDNSRDILNKYKNLNNIKILYNERNRGAAYSRNVGLKEITGNYVGFIDSDDYIEPNYYEKLYSALKKENADIAFCDFNVIYMNQNKEIKINLCEGITTKINAINNSLSASCCNKLFKKEIILKYPFPEEKMNEDIAVAIPAIANSKKIVHVSNLYYNYYQRKNSVQNSNFSLKRFDIFDTVLIAKERMKDNKELNEIMDILYFQQIIALLYYVISKEKKFIKRNKFIKIFAKKVNSINFINNKYNQEFINNNGRLHKYFYKMLNYLIDKNLPTLANLSMLSADIIKKMRASKKVIKENLSINDSIEVATLQRDMPNNDIKISVVIPNYNYKNFLIQRLFSILNQDYKINEILILDDCSKDNSRELIDEIVLKLKPYLNIRKLYNKENSGTAFKQWKKGFENVTGDYVWIAEADDYCNKKLLSNLVKPLKNNKDIIISYADTAFIDVDGNIIIRSIKPEIDIQKTGHWDNNFINNGIDEINNYSFLNCTIANVSSCLIKNNNYNDLIGKSLNYKQVGDWLFYLNLMQLGKISYINKALNYYRLHGDNVSSTMNQKKHLEEIKKIYKELDDNLKLTNEQKKKQTERINFLEKAWKLK